MLPLWLEILSVISNFRLYHIPSPLWSLHFKGLYEDINNKRANEEGGNPPGDLNSTEKNCRQLNISGNLEIVFPRDEYTNWLYIASSSPLWQTLCPHIWPFLPHYEGLHFLMYCPSIPHYYGLYFFIHRHSFPTMTDYISP